MQGAPAGSRHDWRRVIVGIRFYWMSKRNLKHSKGPRIPHKSKNLLRLAVTRQALYELRQYRDSLQALGVGPNISESMYVRWTAPTCQRSLANHCACSRALIKGHMGWLHVAIKLQARADTES